MKMTFKIDPDKSQTVKVLRNKLSDAMGRESAYGNILDRIDYHKKLKTEGNEEFIEFIRSCFQRAGDDRARYSKRLREVTRNREK